MDAGGKKGSVKSDINVTPLVDIVLVLLIIFIVITPAVNDSVSLPLAKHSPKVEKNTGEKYLQITFQAKKDATGLYSPGNINIDDPAAKNISFKINDAASKQLFVDYVTKSTSTLSYRRVFVKADRNLPYAAVDKLFQACREGGADEASIVTAAAKDSKENTEGGK